MPCEATVSQWVFQWNRAVIMADSRCSEQGEIRAAQHTATVCFN